MTPARRRALATGLNVAVLVVFIVAVEHYWGWRRLLAPWRHLPGLELALALGGLLVSYAVRALRIYLAEREVPRGQFLQCLRLILLNNVFNLLLPMRSGEASFPLLMRRWFAIDLGRATGILVWLRVLDLHVLGAIGVVCAAGGWLGHDPDIKIAAGVLAALTVAAPLVLYALRAPLARRLTPRSDRLSGLLLKLVNGLPNSAMGLFRDVLLSWIAWLIKLAALGAVLSSLGGLKPMLGVLGAIGGDLSTVLPIHAPGGFGTYEAGVLALLAPAQAPSPALLAAAVNLHLLVLTTALLAGAVAWLMPGPRR